MSTISSATTAQFHAQRSHGSGKERMSTTISGALSAGTLSSTDATALTGALSSIDASLSLDSTSSTTGAKLDPASMKDRIDGLIADQVSSGTLTSDQASALKNLFASHGRSTQTASATDDVAEAGGPPPGPPPGPPLGGAASNDTSGTASSDVGTSSSSSSDLLASFIQQLQAAQSSTATYGASGSTRSYGSAALLVDFQS